MLFSVIYSVDMPKDHSVQEWRPANHRKWELTEWDDHEGELAYANLPKHRKYCKLLTRKEFDDFVWDQGLYMEDVETMGSIGAPGLGLFLAPAVSFTGDNDQIYQSAYVTPIPDRISEKFELTERHWNMVYKAMLSVYGV